MAITTSDYAQPGRSMVKTYAHVVDGKIAAIATVSASETKPFGMTPRRHDTGRIDPSTEHVLNITGAICQLGWLVDGMGQMTPAPVGWTRALGIDESVHSVRELSPVEMAQFRKSVAGS